MNDFKLNTTTWDIEQNDGKSGWLTVSSNEAIAQNMRQRLQTVVGEWFLNTTIYVDLFDLIFVKGTPAAVIESHLKDIISNTIGFIAFQKFNLDINTQLRTLTLDFVCETVDGVIQYNRLISENNSNLFTTTV